jgi:hypothetical protein
MNEARIVIEQDETVLHVQLENVGSLLGLVSDGHREAAIDHVFVALGFAMKVVEVALHYVWKRSGAVTGTHTRSSVKVLQPWRDRSLLRLR